MKRIILSALMLVSFSSLASIAKCEFNAGSITTCDMYTSANDVPLLGESGKVSACGVIAGDKGKCTLSYDGTIILKQGNLYAECQVSNGDIGRCTLPNYSGTSIIDTGQG